MPATTEAEQVLRDAAREMVKYLYVTPAAGTLHYSTEPPRPEHEMYVWGGTTVVLKAEDGKFFMLGNDGFGKLCWKKAEPDPAMLKGWTEVG